MPSARKESSHAPTRISRLASRWRKGEPKERWASSGLRPLAIASEICNCISSSISRFSALPRNRFVILRQADISGLPQHTVHGRRHRFPARFFHAQLLPARRRQFVDSSTPPGLFRNPFGANPARLFHAVQGRVEGALLHPKYLGGNVLNGGHNGVAMEARPPGENFENQQIERALQGIGFRWHT